MCLFGDMNNALQQQINLHVKFITTWRTQIEFTLFTEVYLMGIGIKHYSLMMSLARPFKIQNGMDFSLSHLMVVNYPKKRCKVRPCVSVMAAVEGFTLCKDNLRPFHSHYSILEIIVPFSLSILFLVQPIWRKFEHGFSDIVTSFRWRPKYTLNMSLFYLYFPCFSFHVRLIICFCFI